MKFETKRSEFKPEESRAAWLRHGLPELTFWLQHIDEKTAHLIEEQSQDRLRYIEQAELIFDYCAVINRLAQIDLREAGHIPLGEFVDWLASTTGWPHHVAKAFWYCVRNPTLHMGRAWAMADYGEKHGKASIYGGFHPDMSFESGSAWHEWPQFTADELKVEFYLSGLRRTVEQMLNDVTERVRTASDDELWKLIKLIDRIPFFYVPEEPAESLTPDEPVDPSAGSL